MIKLKKIAAAAMSITMLAVMLTGCGDEESSSKSSSSSEASSESGNSNLQEFKNTGILQSG